MVRTVTPKTASNYSAGLLRFTHFCDDLHIDEETRMPAPEWLLSTFITSHGVGIVGKGAMVTWLQGLELWHAINNAPWHGARHLKRALQGACSRLQPPL